jgi:hypothetical protein
MVIGKSELGPVAGVVIRAICGTVTHYNPWKNPAVGTAGQNLPTPISQFKATMARGIEFQNAVLKGLDIPENKRRFTVNVPGGGQFTFSRMGSPARNSLKLKTFFI